MNHRRRRAVLRDPRFSKEAFSAFSSVDAYIQAARDGLNRATEKHLKDVQVLTEKNNLLGQELEKCRTQLTVATTELEESKKASSVKLKAAQMGEKEAKRLHAAGERVLTRVREAKNKLQDQNIQLGEELKDVRAQLADSIKENEMLRGGIFSMWPNLPYDSSEMQGTDRSPVRTPVLLSSSPHSVGPRALTVAAARFGPRSGCSLPPHAASPAAAALALLPRSRPGPRPSSSPASSRCPALWPRLALPSSPLLHPVTATPPRPACHLARSRPCCGRLPRATASAAAPSPLLVTTTVPPPTPHPPAPLARAGLAHAGLATCQVRRPSPTPLGIHPLGPRPAPAPASPVWAAPAAPEPTMALRAHDSWAPPL
nr:transcriptional regulatory protein AlgP-like [Aegilops tauschii subsp. strangulata]